MFFGFTLGRGVAKPLWPSWWWKMKKLPWTSADMWSGNLEWADLQKWTPCSERRVWVEQRAQNIFQERVLLGEILREMWGFYCQSVLGLNLTTPGPWEVARTWLKASQVALCVLEQLLWGWKALVICTHSFLFIFGKLVEGSSLDASLETA